MKNYIDEYGMLAQGEPSNDGGDSCQRMGMYHFGAAIREKIGIKTSLHKWPRSHPKFYELALSKLQRKDGVLRRHPNPNMWYSDWDRASRDQTIPFLCACGMLGLKSNLWRYFRSHAKRFLLFTSNTVSNWVYSPDHPEHIEFDWSPWKRFKFFFGWRPKNDRGDKESVYGKKLPDLTILEFWGLEIRALKLWPLYPLLFVCDLESLVSAFLWRFREKDNDCLNAVITYVNGTFRYPTPVMWLSCKIIYWKEMQQKMNKYFTKTPIEITPMAAFYEPITQWMGEKYNG